MIVTVEEELDHVQGRVQVVVAMAMPLASPIVSNHGHGLRPRRQQSQHRNEGTNSHRPPVHPESMPNVPCPGKPWAHFKLAEGWE